uniref:Uncharacterized protein n=1 Tax=Magallana gigas TaxID=29159 RepID=K1PPP2_MAGGI
MERAGFEGRLRSLLVDYLSSTNTRTMTPVRKHILQLVMFLYGEENFDQLGRFSYSKSKEVADQQRKFVLFGFLFMEALKKHTVTETDLTTLQRMWGQHILSLVNNDQQRKFVLFGFLFMEALKKHTVTETDLTTLQRMWGQHILSLVNNEMKKTAERYERILHNSEETIFNIKRFQRNLERTKYREPIHWSRDKD